MIASCPDSFRNRDRQTNDPDFCGCALYIEGQCFNLLSGQKEPSRRSNRDLAMERHVTLVLVIGGQEADPFMHLGRECEAESVTIEIAAEHLVQDVGRQILSSLQFDKQRQNP
jgi:hypothetical protein